MEPKGAMIDERAVEKLLEFLSGLPHVQAVELLESVKPRKGELRVPNVCFLEDGYSVKGTMIGIETIRRFNVIPISGVTSSVLMWELIRMVGSRIDIQGIYSQVMTESGIALEGGFGLGASYDKLPNRGLVRLVDKETIACDIFCGQLSRWRGVAQVIPGEVIVRDRIASEVSKEVEIRGYELLVTFHGRSIKRAIRVVTTIAMNPAALRTEILSRRHFDLNSMIRRSQALALTRGDGKAGRVCDDRFITGCREIARLISEIPGVSSVRAAEHDGLNDASQPTEVETGQLGVIVTYRNGADWQRLIVTPEAMDGRLGELASRIRQELGLNGRNESGTGAKSDRASQIAQT
ncbi:MAG: hypothetical protein PHI73_01870 [Patescibacteria group bacterium]|nr:hypothetical protein [Patescibacteria group bacterium]